MHGLKLVLAGCNRFLTQHSSSLPHYPACILNKSELRKQMLACRQRVSATELSEAGRNVCRSLRDLVDIETTQWVAAYAAVGNEVDVSEFVDFCRKQRMETLFPRFDPVTSGYQMVNISYPETQLRRGHYGILEPVPELMPVAQEKLAAPELVWLVPGLAFDRKLARLGRGRGYYDRMLNGVRGTKIGIGFDWQLLEDVPCNRHDVGMDVIVTDKQIVRSAISSR